MKLIKLRLYIISFVSFLTVTMVSAQQDAKWRLSLGVNAVDIRTPDDFTGFFKDYFNGSIEDVNLYGQPFRLAFTRKLTDNWSTQVSLSSNIIKKGFNWGEGDPLKKDQFFNVDAKALYDLNAIIGKTGRFDPYLGLGVGYSKTTLNDFKVNGSWGLNVFITDQWGLNFESSYNHNFKDSFNNKGGTGTDFFQHDLGLFFNFGANKDTDGDGISDTKDKCPTEFGVELREGCPESKTPENTDTDGDGVMDAKDNCPKVVGTVANKGCAEKDTDGDGIKDHLDKCPEEKGIVAKNGCPEPIVVNEGVMDIFQAEKMKLF